MIGLGRASVMLTTVNSYFSESELDVSGEFYFADTWEKKGRKRLSQNFHIKIFRFSLDKRHVRFGVYDIFLGTLTSFMLQVSIPVRFIRGIELSIFCTRVVPAQGYLSHGNR